MGCLLSPLPLPLPAHSAHVSPASPENIWGGIHCTWDKCRTRHGLVWPMRERGVWECQGGSQGTWGILVPLTQMRDQGATCYGGNMMDLFGAACRRDVWVTVGWRWPCGRSGGQKRAAGELMEPGWKWTPCRRGGGGAETCLGAVRVRGETGGNRTMENHSFGRKNQRWLGPTERSEGTWTM